MHPKQLFSVVAGHICLICGASPVGTSTTFSTGTFGNGPLCVQWGEWRTSAIGFCAARVTSQQRNPTLGEGKPRIPNGTHLQPSSAESLQTPNEHVSYLWGDCCTVVQHVSTTPGIVSTRVEMARLQFQMQKPCQKNRGVANLRAIKWKLN